MKITELKEHELNIKIYGNEIVDIDLVESIRNNGLLVPLTVKKDGTIISGHRRFKAIKETDITEVPVNIIEFKNEMEEKETLINFNKQRDKTYSQKFNEAKELEIIESEKAKLRQAENVKNINNSKNKDKNVSLPLNSKEVKKKQQYDNKKSVKQTKSIIAKTTGFGSEDTFRKYEKIKEADNPDLIKKLDKGEITINKAYQDIKKAERREAIKNSESKLPSGAIDIYNTTNKYRIIYADPPWSYHNKTTGTMPQDHYKLMTLEDICNMPIKNISEDNAVLFLWVVVPQIEEALQVIKAWGFKYKTHFVWDKIKHNLGHYSSVRHELLFICTKGSCQPDNLKLYDSVYSEERTEHSKKPEYFRNLIEMLYLGNKIELFARSKNKGWDFYGNELLETKI
jgi:N6-adenosine-specific RNA methylase IME4